MTLSTRRYSLMFTSALAMAAGCNACPNNDTPDAGPTITETKGDGKIIIGGEEKLYSIVPGESRLLVLNLHIRSAACNFFHDHAVASLATSYEFTLNKDNPTASVLTATVNTAGMDPDKPEYRQIFPETRDADNADPDDDSPPTESQRSEIRGSVFEQLDAQSHPILTFRATELTTLDGTGTAPLAIRIRGQDGSSTMNATATWAGEKLIITGQAQLDGNQFGMPVGSLKDCIDPNMRLDMVLTLAPGGSADAGALGDGGGVFKPTFFDGGLEGCSSVGYNTVENMLLMRCGGCHSDPPRLGASIPLTEYGHFRVNTRRNPDLDVASAAVARMESTGPERMPPAHTGDPVPAAELAMINQWVAEGAKYSSCSGDAGLPPRPTSFMGSPTRFLDGGAACGTLGWSDMESVFVGSLCLGCHNNEPVNRPLPAFDHYAARNDGGIGGIDMNGQHVRAVHPFYSDLNIWEAAYHRMLDQTMPPGVPDPALGLAEWPNASEANMDLLRTWIEEGAPFDKCPAGPPTDAGPALLTCPDAGPGTPGALTSVRVLTPNGGEVISGEMVIAYSVNGTDNVTITEIAAFAGGDKIVLSTSAPLTGCFTFDTNTPTTVDGTDYRIQITARSPNPDGGTQLRKLDQSDRDFTIENGQIFTDLTYDDVKDYLGTDPLTNAGHCVRCHTVPTHQPGIGVPQTFRLDRYGPDDAGIPGAYSRRLRIAANVRSGYMPYFKWNDGGTGPNGPPRLDDAGAQAIINWATGGAPP